MKKCGVFLLVLCLLISYCSFLSACQRSSANYSYYSNRACMNQDKLYYVLNTDKYGELYCNGQKIYSCLGYGFRSVFVNENYIFLSVCSLESSYQAEKVSMLDKQGYFIRDFDIVSITIHGDNEYVFTECGDYKYYIDLSAFTVAELCNSQQISNWKYVRKMLINLNTNINAFRYYKQHEEVIGTTEQGLFIFSKSTDKTRVIFFDYATNTDIEVFSETNNDPYTKIIGQLGKNTVLVRLNHLPVSPYIKSTEFTAVYSYDTIENIITEEYRSNKGEEIAYWDRNKIVLINADKELTVKSLADETIIYEKKLKGVKKQSYDIQVIDKHFFMHDSHTGELIYHLVMW